MLKWEPLALSLPILVFEAEWAKSYQSEMRLRNFYSTHQSYDHQEDIQTMALKIYHCLVQMGWSLECYQTEIVVVQEVT
jgi:hypothetical protein